MDSSYIYHRIPKYRHKKIAGYRLIEEPKEVLKLKQYEVLARLNYLLPRVIFPKYVYGIQGTSAIDNAAQHQGARVVFKIDIASFFPTTTYNVISGGLYTLIDVAGGPLPWEIYAELLVRISSYCLLEGRLPTGAPTSPMLSNIAMLPYDSKIKALADSYNLKYTRYADDLTFSGDYRPKGFVNKVAELIYPYKVNWAKVESAHHTYQRQEVTGVVINNIEYKSVSRTKRKELRAKLDHLARDGKVIDESVRGELLYVKSVNEDQYDALVRGYEQRLKFYGKHEASQGSPSTK